MRHEKVQQQLSAFLEGDLGPRRHAELEAHLVECETCRAELRALRRTVEMLRGLPAPEPPPQLADAVIARIGVENGRLENRGLGLAQRLSSLASTLFGGPWLAPVGAAALAAALFLSVSGPETAPGAADAAATASVSVADAGSRTREGARGIRPSATPREPAHFTVSAPGSRRSAPGQVIPASTAPPEGGVRESLPPLAICLAASRSTDPAAASSVSAQRETCARWYAWMVGLARQDAPAFIQELDRLPVSERAEWLARLSEFATYSGSAPLLAPELRAAPDPRGGAIAIHFERGTPAAR